MSKLKPVQTLEMFPDYPEYVARSKGLKKLIYRVLPIPLHCFFPLRAEIHMAWIRLKSWRTPRHFKDAQNLLVNLGAGDGGKPGWVNVDISDGPGVNCIYDVRKKFPFPDNSVKGIFCEHVFEHIDYTEEAPFFLSEAYRSLKKGGVLRIIVPDIEKYLHGYCEAGWETLQKIRRLGEGNTDPYIHYRYHTKMELINVLFRQGHEHKYAYDFATLEFLLYRYGFSEVHQQEFGMSVMEGLALDRISRASESLYVDAVK